MRRLVLSKPVASRTWVSAFCIVPVVAIIAVSSFVLSPVHRHHTGAASTASPASRGRIQANYASLPLAFEQNQGQTDAQVKYMARGDGYTLFLTANDAVFSLHSSSAKSATSALRRGTELRAKNSRQLPAQENSTAVVRMQLAGGNSWAKVSASDQLPGKSNYFLGNDPGKWHSDVPHYARVSYHDVYPGVNLAFHGAQRQTEFDFVVAPGANPAPIALHFTGAQGIKTDDSGNLVISSAAGNVLLHKPVAYQEQNGARQKVDAQFVLKAGNQVGFELGNYDRSRELVIDPSVSYAYSTYLGGSANDQGQGISFDSSGNAYVAGETSSADFPGHSSTNKLKGAVNVFVSKIASNGSSLIYSTYVGGSGSDSGNSIAVDASGNVSVAGGTSSIDFPVTAGAFQASLKGTTSNAFVFKLSSSGALSHCTYLGGTGTDTALGIALATDGSGDVFVVGKTSSSDFPLQGALQGLLLGSVGSGFVTKVNATLGAPLAYSTYLGGSSDGDSAGAVAVDSNNHAYVTGQTFNSSFATTSGVFQATCGSCSNGNSNAFVSVINPGGTAFVYSSFLGGTGLDIGDGIAIDSNGNAYIAGTTTSTAFPTTAGALQVVYGGSSDGFVTKVNPQGTALVYSTYLGGSNFDAAASIAVDSSGNAYVTGQTDSSTFPTVGATQSALKGGNDAFVSEINSSGTALVFSTYLGGSVDEDDGGNFGSLAVDNAGANIYVTGNTASTDFPTTSPLQAANAGGNDVFVVKYSQSLTPSFTIAATTPAAVSPGSPGSSAVTLTADNGYNSTVNLTCSVSGGGSPTPTCSTSSFSPNPVTPTSSGAQSTLAIATTGPSAAMYSMKHIFYGMWLPVAGLSLAGLGFSQRGLRRKKLLGVLMLLAVVSTLLALPACGGGGGGGGGGHGGTPAGSYTVTITGTGTDSNTTTQSVKVTLTVN
jgi:hypothetical protein